MHTTQQRRACIGMCKNCGEAYSDCGTDDQRIAWMSTHGAACTRPKDEDMDLERMGVMLRVLYTMPESMLALPN
jgi:hypothetical protein